MLGTFDVTPYQHSGYQLNFLIMLCIPYRALTLAHTCSKTACRLTKMTRRTTS